MRGIFFWASAFATLGLTSIVATADSAGLKLACPIWSDCNRVRDLPWATLWGIHISVLAAFGASVLILLLLAAPEVGRYGTRLQQLAQTGAFLSVLASIGLTSYSVLGANAICFWCVSIAASFCILLVAVVSSPPTKATTVGKCCLRGAMIFTSLPIGFLLGSSNDSPSGLDLKSIGGQPEFFNGQLCIYNCSDCSRQFLLMAKPSCFACVTEFAKVRKYASEHREVAVNLLVIAPNTDSSDQTAKSLLAAAPNADIRRKAAEAIFEECRFSTDEVKLACVRHGVIWKEFHPGRERDQFGVKWITQVGLAKVPTLVERDPQGHVKVSDDLFVSHD